MIAESGFELPIGKEVVRITKCGIIRAAMRIVGISQRVDVWTIVAHSNCSRSCNPGCRSVQSRVLQSGPVSVPPYLGANIDGFGVDIGEGRSALSCGCVGSYGDHIGFGGAWSSPRIGLKIWRCRFS